MSSVDGDSGGRGSSPDDSFDGDDGVRQEAPVRQRGLGRAQQAQPQQQPQPVFGSTGKLILFLIFASSFGLWAEDMSALDIHQWTDTAYGNGNHFLGVVLGRWEFTSGASDSATTEESIFLDLAQLHRKGKHGLLVYRCMRSIILSTTATAFEFPTTTFKVLQKFNSYECKQWTRDGLINSKTLKQYIREWKTEFDIAQAGIHEARFCPKAAWMAVSGWDVWHCVAVSKKDRGAQVIGARM